jgi:hypothetical protein
MAVTARRLRSKTYGWAPPNVEPASTEALRHLKENGIISSKTHTALKDAYRRCGEVQHDDIGAAAREVHSATLAAVEHAPNLLHDVALHLKQRG